MAEAIILLLLILSIVLSLYAKGKNQNRLYFILFLFIFAIFFVTAFSTEKYYINLFEINILLDRNEY